MVIDGTMINQNKKLFLKGSAFGVHTLQQFWVSFHGDCTTFQKKLFPVKSVIMKSTAAPHTASGLA